MLSGDTIKYQYVLMRACMRRNESEPEAGVDSDRTSHKFVEESMALQSREALFNHAHCTARPHQRLNRLLCTFRVIRPSITTHLTSPELVTFTIAASRRKLRWRIARRRRAVSYGVRNFCWRFHVAVARWKHRLEKKNWQDAERCFRTSRRRLQEARKRGGISDGREIWRPDYALKYIIFKSKLVKIFNTKMIK